MEDVRRDLAKLEEQGKVEGFFNNVENAGKLGGLVEAIRDAMMEYQVCVPNYPFLSHLTYLCQTSLQQGIYDKQQDIHDKSRLLVVSLTLLTFHPHGLINE